MEENKNIYYVYAHRKADNKHIFYIGKGKGRRINQKHGRSQLWQRTVSKHGLEKEILFSNLSEEEAFKIEVETIAFFIENGVNLCNRTDGGEGISGLKHTEEACKKISMAHKGKKHPIELVMLRANKNRGKKRTPEQIKKSVDKRIGRKASPETKAKMSAARTGKKHSKEHIEKTAAWHTGQKRSIESRKNMSNAQEKRPVLCSNGMLFESITLAAKWLNETINPKATKTGIWACLTGKHKMSYGFKWEYAPNT
jgi:hypothetical protein